MYFYQQFLKEYYAQIHRPAHWWVIVLQKGKPNQLECVKCGKICQTQEEYDKGECLTG